MRNRQPLPNIWMFSDERMGDLFLPALAQLPKGAGLVFRHYALAMPERRALFAAARKIARARRIVIVLAGPVREARAWRADGVHGVRGMKGLKTPLILRLPKDRPSHPKEAKSSAPLRQAQRERKWIKTAPVHNLRELIAAERARVDLVFLSPVFATRSHLGGRTLGRRGFAALARRAKAPAIALGGMNARRARALKRGYGWAGIDAFTGAY